MWHTLMVAAATLAAVAATRASLASISAGRAGFGTGYDSFITHQPRRARPLVSQLAYSPPVARMWRLVRRATR